MIWGRGPEFKKDKGIDLGPKGRIKKDMLWNHEPEFKKARKLIWGHDQN